MHFKWKYLPPTQEETSEAKALGEKLNIRKILYLLLFRLGIKTESAAKR